MTSWMVRPLISRCSQTSTAVKHIIGVVTVGDGLPQVVSCGPPHYGGLSVPLTRLDQDRQKLYLTSIHYFSLLRGEWLKLRRTGVLRRSDGVVVRLIEEN